ncbi:uncharacterized protein NECHADRAFT_97919 [Fusarium vanettenii 77-13-4]|uniref:Uncharacterized protein n=1 Tax=Fusarium vanettenii (strain ATCC MYA-4622 / CBS 123669 / FGSC 9596 / NRRL 45880 / 77-13-4) TaxID=660122 RepID=C7ZN97_FUSV7|nr:uncharacterized protein NECHADRAFT_97919 [Fusarium vanettenii 77-13-4]EEU34529.1 hypothetical protein NECHADRAFT_97919 [Fusarium vanettenii 77-13-4]
MRSNVLFLAIGLLVTDSALAGPCKPRSSTSDTAAMTSIVSTTQPTTTAAETSTTVPVASSETFIEAGTTTAIASDTATTSEAETTTAAEGTTTAAVATPTFTIVGGGGSVQGQPLKGVDQEGTILLFNPQFGNIVTRTFILDPDTGRLRDKNTGTLVCAYYGLTNTPSDPANVGYCQTGNTGPDMYYDYLTCQVVSGKLTCTAPKAACPTDDDGNQSCTTQAGSDVNNQFYYKFTPSAGDYLYISSGSPGGYTSLDVLARES